ncbi:uncharacterized protein V6R79_020330 [Siganus canaliculatus]
MQMNRDVGGNQRYVSSSDRYSFKGVFKALASVAGVADNLCNKSCRRAERLSDRSADKNTRSRRLTEPGEVQLQGSGSQLGPNDNVSTTFMKLSRPFGELICANTRDKKHLFYL